MCAPSLPEDKPSNLAPDNSDDIAVADDIVAADDFAPGDGDAELARSSLDAGATFTDDAFVTTSGLIDATSLFDQQARHHRPSPWGRLDLEITWRSVEASSSTSLSTEPRREEIWLVAIWRH